jgi:selenocysteine lyase/cysteine desulfurase
VPGIFCYPCPRFVPLVARGLRWQAGDEVVYHPDDYPANVYPWIALEPLGVKAVPLRPAVPGRITWEALEPLLTPRTRLVALASCHYLTGFRIAIDTIGMRLRERNVLFCLDAIQTLGAFPTPARFVDFMAADSHKWMLGPCGAGLFHVKASRQELLDPLLLGAWNVRSPDFIAQPAVVLEDGARRYEPGTPNLPGLCGMGASLKMLEDWGVEEIAARLLHLRARMVAGLRDAGFHIYPDDLPGADPTPEEAQSAIVAAWHPERDPRAVFQELASRGVSASLRKAHDGRWLLRFSPHAHISDAEVDQAMGLLA